MEPRYLAIYSGERLVNTRQIPSIIMKKYRAKNIIA